MSQQPGTYPQPYFELQLTVARKLAQLTRQPFTEAVLHYTALYRLLVMDWRPDPLNPTWQAYLRLLEDEQSAGERTYHFYLQRLPSLNSFSSFPHWGCFAFSYDTGTHIVQPHFSNQDTSGASPLSQQRQPARHEELKGMFQHIHQTYPQALLVQGGSWLYNWEAYCRLFPRVYTKTARSIEKPPLAGRAIWEQFLRRNGQVHRESQELFLQRVEQLDHIEQAPRCFPYPLVQVQAPIRLFYDFYRV